MKYPRHPGIYAIRHIDSDWAYIGSSRNIYPRWRSHKADLRNNKHHCPHLQNAWNKYGESAFVFEVLEICFDDPVVLYHREQIWIDHAKARLYNTSHQSEPGASRKISEEHRAILRNRMLGNKNGANKSYCGVLKAEDIQQIIFRYASGDRCQAIAVDFKVSYMNIRRIVKRIIWDEVVIPPEIEQARLDRVKTKDTGRTGKKLDYEKAEEIRALYKSGIKIADIGRQFNITGTHVRFVIDYKQWASPPPVAPTLDPIPKNEKVKLSPIEKSYRARTKPQIPRPTIPRTSTPCEVCGTIVMRRPCDIRSKKHCYCSKDCSRSRMSERTTLIMADPAMRARLSELNRGKKHSAETRAKMSATKAKRRLRNDQPGLFPSPDDTSSKEPR